MLRGLETVSGSETHYGGSSLESVILRLCLINGQQIAGAVSRGMCNEWVEITTNLLVWAILEVIR